MGHQPTPDGAEEKGAQSGPTVYDRNGDLESDPKAENWWSDDLTERLNLRIPEWMYDDLQQHADYQQQEISQVAREMIEYALMNVSFNGWNGIKEYGRHTYGDVQCPSCACEHGLKLRWRKKRDGNPIVTCHECGVEFPMKFGRSMKGLDRDLAEIWLSYALNDEYGSEDIIAEFEAFLAAPREFVGLVDWHEDRTSSGRVIDEMTRTAQSHSEKINEHLENWEAKREDDE